MPSTPNHNRRWFWFSLATMFVMVTLAACWLGWELHIVRERKHLRATLIGRGAQFGDHRWDGMPIRKRNVVRRLLGDELAPMITLPSDCWTPTANGEGVDVDDIERVFPEAEIMQNL